MRQVMVFGTFDGLHPGHLNFLKQASKHGSYLTVVVARDKNVKKIKGKNPKYSESQRLKQIISSNQADRVILGQIRDVYQVVRKEKPDIIALGYDQNSFTKDLEMKFPNVRVIRLKSYRPGTYKSSKINI